MRFYRAKIGLICALIALMSLNSCVFVSALEPLYRLYQDGSTWFVSPIKGGVSAPSFYDFYSYSGHTPYMESHASKIYLYQDTGTGELSLIMHNGIDDDSPGTMIVKFYFSGIPEGAYVSVSDEPKGLGVSPRSPTYAEFDLNLNPEAYWANTYNSDGGSLSGLPLDECWSISISPEFIQGIDSWAFIDSDESEIQLQMDKPIRICPEPCAPQFPIPELPLGTISAIAAGLISLLLVGRRPHFF